MKANQHLGHEKTTQAGVPDGFRSMPADVETIAPSGVQPVGHGHDTKPAEGLTPKKKILIVDDDRRNVKLLAARLPMNNFESIFAYEGNSAIKAAQTESPDLILLDVLMPEMDGYEVTRKLKNNPNTRDIPIILVTSLNGPEEKTKGLKAGADEFLSKPIHYAELLTRVRSLLRLKDYQERKPQTAMFQESLMESIIPAEMTAKEEAVSSILLIEIDEKDGRLIQDCLNGQKCKINWVRDWKEAISLLSQEKKDLMILSLPLPGAEGLKFCKRLKGMENTKSMKIMVLAGPKDCSNSVSCEDFGIDDFMIKPVDTEEFRTRLKLLLTMKSEADRLMGRPQTSVRESIMDRQSGLYDRSYFSYQLDLEIKRSLRRKYCLTLIMIQVGLSEMDGGKYGSLTMGEIMKQYGKLLKGCILDEDLATYFRENQFAIALPYLERDNAENIAKRIHRAIINHNVFTQESPHSHAVTASFGIAFCPYDACTAEQLIRKADAALGRAKREGKDGICKWEENHTAEK